VPLLVLNDNRVLQDNRIRTSNPKELRRERSGKRANVCQFSPPILTSLLFIVMVKVTHAPLLPRALRERQTRREAGAQSHGSP